MFLLNCKNLTLFILLSCLVAEQPLIGNDLEQPIRRVEPNVTDDFSVPERPESQEPAKVEFDLKSLLGESGLKVGIGFGILLVLTLLFSKRKPTYGLPQDAVEVLGVVPLATRQRVQLIRFGQKLVLVEASANGLTPISEITDPVEVNRMLDLIRPRTRRGQ